MDAIRVAGGAMFIALLMNLNEETKPDTSLVQEEKRRILNRVVLSQYVH